MEVAIYTIGAIVSYLAIALLLKAVILPYLRIKKNIRYEDKIDQEMLEDMGSLFWPLIPFLPLVHLIFGAFHLSEALSKKTEKFLLEKEEINRLKIIEEPKVDVAKSTYRHIQYDKE